MARRDAGEQQDAKRARKTQQTTGLTAWFAADGGRPEANWMAVDAETIRDAIAAAGSRGGALRFGYTSDMGAFAIGVYDGDAKHTEYVRPGESVEYALGRIVEYFRTP